MHGKLFRRILDKFQLTQQQLGSELGISPQYISDIVNDRKQSPKKTWGTLKEKYNINTEYLLTGEGEMFLIEKGKEIDKQKLFEEKYQSLNEDEKEFFDKIIDKAWDAYNGDKDAANWIIGFAETLKEKEKQEDSK